MTAIRIQPIADNLFVRRAVVDNLSAGGVIIPDSATEVSTRGVIEAVGDDVKSPLTIGATVLFSKHAGIDAKINDVDCLVLKQKDVLAVLF